MRQIDRSSLALVLTAVLGTAGSALANPTQFTTLNSSVVTLTSHSGTTLTPSPSVTYNGPSVLLPPWSSSTIITDGDRNFGTGAWLVNNPFDDFDQVGAQYTNSTISTYALEMSWNVTFSERVRLFSINLNPLDGFGTLTFTPTGGSATNFIIGTQLAAGTYDIVWIYDETTPRTGATQTFLFEAVANPIPGAGVAAIAALGVGGLARRRRR
jgi:hypothetical protein